MHGQQNIEFISVCPYVLARLPLDRFPWNLISRTFKKICRETANLVKNRTISDNWHKESCAFISLIAIRNISYIDNNAKELDVFWQCIMNWLYRVSQEERAKLREGVSYVELYRYNPKHLYTKLNGYGDNGQRSLKLWQLLHTYRLPNSY